MFIYNLLMKIIAKLALAHLQEYILLIITSFIYFKNYTLKSENIVSLLYYV